MKILYVAKHGRHDNQDEDAISYALRALGHEVLCLGETEARSTLLSKAGFKLQSQHDFLLFNKWEDVDALKRLEIPRVFWFFDLIQWPDPEFRQRGIVREKWMRDVTHLCLTGFCTDGDWVSGWNKETTEAEQGGFGKWGPKLHWLMQGADERVTGLGVPNPSLACDILFTGSVIHGGKRISHIEHLKQRWGSQFKAMGHKPKDRVHGRALADLYASAKVVIAPDGPVTDLYWSNRVYLTLGFGGFLIHPQCDGLIDQYPRYALETYASRSHLDDKIDYYLTSQPAARNLAEAGYNLTIASHLYRHRCKELVQIVEELL